MIYPIFCFQHGLKRRVIGLFKSCSTYALLQKIARWRNEFKLFCKCSFLYDQKLIGTASVSIVKYQISFSLYSEWSLSHYMSSMCVCCVGFVFFKWFGDWFVAVLVTAWTRNCVSMLSSHKRSHHISRTQKSHQNLTSLDRQNRFGNHHQVNDSGQHQDFLIKDNAV